MKELPLSIKYDDADTDNHSNPKYKDHPPKRWNQKDNRNLCYIVALVAFVLSLSCISCYLYPKAPRYPQCWPMLGTEVESQSRLILAVSHLRHGPDGALRLRIIQHNLQLLFSDNTSNNANKKPLRSILIFSTDNDGSESEFQVNAMINDWRSGPAKGLVHDVILVENDAVAVDVKKWMTALTSSTIQAEIWKTNARVMLTNDSFLLVRDVPELWDDDCGGVCGLVWSAPKSVPSRHIQSYMRTLSSCEIDNYLSFCNQNEDSVHNVNELIETFEVNLGWAHGKVSAIFDDVGDHPDADEAQRKLLPRGYPAIKLKKFFVTNDPWIAENKITRPRLSPSFSHDIYRRMNHELNHFSDQELEDQFAEAGFAQDRIYSTLPLIMKDWIREELNVMGDAGQSTLQLLEDYLDALNRVVNAKVV